MAVKDTSIGKTEEMSKPLNKGGMEQPTSQTGKLLHRNHYQTRAATQATTTNKVDAQQSAAEDATPKEA